MPRIFITGSSDGLGLLAGKMLAEPGRMHPAALRQETQDRLMDYLKGIAGAIA
jgi:NAD(P)-dependent dehydrogenase (short-subunit alcohol dehydrogenase family)